MKKIIWILGGGILLSAAFFMQGTAVGIWQAMLYASIAAAVFLIAFTAFYSPNQTGPSNKKRVAAVTGLLLILFFAHYWFGLQEATKQKQNMVDIREVIEAGIAKNYVNDMLLHTLRSHYQAGNSANDLGALFQSRYDSLISDGIIDYHNFKNDETLHIALAKTSPDSVVLVAYSTQVLGQQQTYKNYNGETGYFEAKGVLTKRGITYERTN